MLWHGALGYTKGAGLERALRGTMSYMTGAEGALNIMRVLVSRSLLGKEYLPYK
jgi:acyl-CoA dehydrogenase